MDKIPQTMPIDLVAERLGVSEWTVRSWLRSGRMPYFKVGKRVLVAVTDIEHLLAAHYTPARRPVETASNGAAGRGVKSRAAARWLFVSCAGCSAWSAQAAGRADHAALRPRRLSRAGRGRRRVGVLDVTELRPPGPPYRGTCAECKSATLCFWIASRRVLWCLPCWRRWARTPDYRQLPLRFDGAAP